MARESWVHSAQDFLCYQIADVLSAWYLPGAVQVGRNWPFQLCHSWRERVSNQRFIFLTFLAAGLAGGSVIRSASISGMLSFGVADSMVAGLLPLSSIIGIVAGFVTFFVLFKNPVAVAYTDEAIGELVKVTWPDRQETINSSMVVIVATLIFSGSLAFFDFVWARVTNIFLFSAG